MITRGVRNVLIAWLLLTGIASTETIDVGFEVPEITDAAIGAAIRSTRPITVDRAMYASLGGLTWSAGTSAGATRRSWANR